MASSSNGGTGKLPHILVVDDCRVQRMVTERLLKFFSFRVTTVDSGEKALELLGLAAAMKVDMVLTDYTMPKMTGYDLLKRLKDSSVFHGIPVVIISSENHCTNMKTRFLEQGAVDFMMKPLHKSDIRRLYSHFLPPDQTLIKKKGDDEEEGNK